MVRCRLLAGVGALVGVLPDDDELSCDCGPCIGGLSDWLLIRELECRLEFNEDEFWWCDELCWFCALFVCWPDCCWPLFWPTGRQFDSGLLFRFGLLRLFMPAVSRLWFEPALFDISVSGQSDN